MVMALTGGYAQEFAVADERTTRTCPDGLGMRRRRCWKPHDRSVNFQRGGFAGEIYSRWCLARGTAKTICWAIWAKIFTTSPKRVHDGDDHTV